VLKAYSFQIFTFGIGFYIILHKDTKQHNNNLASNPTVQNNEERTSDENSVCGKDAPYPFFDTPWLALLKTSTMFVGEIEFSDIPVEGGNVNVVLGYLYYLAFLFIVVLVLMNLLNAMAVSDITQIRKESELECMLLNIKEIRDSRNKLELSPIAIVVLFILVCLITPFIVPVIICGLCCLPCILWKYGAAFINQIRRFFNSPYTLIASVKNRVTILAINPTTAILTLPIRSANRY
jgi:hypothetical protein